MKKKRNVFKLMWWGVKRKAHKVWKKIDKDDVLTEMNQIGFDIFKIALYDDNNIKFLSPKKSNKMYIVTKDYIMHKDINVFIVFEKAQNGYSRLNIVNHEYKYPFDIPEKTANIMQDMFDDKVEEDRNAMEFEIMNNITTSLYQVLSDFKDKLANGKN